MNENLIDDYYKIGKATDGIELENIKLKLTDELKSSGLKSSDWISIVKSIFDSATDHMNSSQLHNFVNALEITTIYEDTKQNKYLQILVKYLVANYISHYAEFQEDSYFQEA